MLRSATTGSAEPVRIDPLLKKKELHFFSIEDAKIFLTFLGTDFRASDRRSCHLRVENRSKNIKKKVDHQSLRCFKMCGTKFYMRAEGVTFIVY